MAGTQPMKSPNQDPDVQRRALEILAEEGPLSHEQVSDELGFDWDNTQKVIRGLRNEGKVSITLDRRYEAEGPDLSSL